MGEPSSFSVLRRLPWSVFLRRRRRVRGVPKAADSASIEPECETLTEAPSAAKLRALMFRAWAKWAIVMAFSEEILFAMASASCLEMFLSSAFNTSTKSGL